MPRIVILLATAAVTALAAATTLANAAGAPALTGPFIGSYSASLTADQAITRGDARMAGRFYLVLRKNGTYTVSNPLDGASRGRVEALAGKRLRFHSDSGCTFGGFERPQGGIYRWSLEGRLLTLRRVSEGPCWGRTQSLTYPVWKRR